MKKALAIVTLNTVLLFVVIEIVLRLCGMDPRQALINPEGPYIRHPQLRWALKPGYHRQWAGVDVQINDKGLRDRPIDYAKPAGEKRVLVLGGSVTFGYSVPVETGYVARLEQELPGVRAINTGVGGYSAFQFLEYLKTEGVRFQPDVVVLTFALNDVLERYLIVEELGGTGVYRGGRKTELQLSEAKTPGQAAWRFVQDLPRKTAFYTLARHIKIRMVAKSRGEKELNDQIWMAKKVIHGDDNARLQEAWAKTFEELQQWIDITRAHGATPVLLYVPYRLELEEGVIPNRPVKKVGDFCASRNVVMVDVTPAMAQAARGQPGRLFLDEDHPTVEGHALIARQLAETLRKLPALSSK